MNRTKRTTVQTTVRHRIELDPKDIIDLLATSGMFVVPYDAEVSASDGRCEVDVTFTNRLVVSWMDFEEVESHDS